MIKNSESVNNNEESHRKLKAKLKTFEDIENTKAKVESKLDQMKKKSLNLKLIQKLSKRTFEFRAKHFNTKIKIYMISRRIKSEPE